MKPGHSASPIILNPLQCQGFLPGLLQPPPSSDMEKTRRVPAVGRFGNGSGEFGNALAAALLH